MVPISRQCSRTILLALSLATALSAAGCASIDGAQDPIYVPSEGVIDPTACPSEKMIKDWDQTAAGRDTIIDKCIDLADRNFDDFVRALRRQSTSANLGTDLVALGLTTGASLSGETGAKTLSALATGVLGVGSTINKDLYYQKTLPALVAAMNANRNVVLARIRQSEAGGLSYTPANARHDVREYTMAGSIDGAITQITAAAKADETEAQDAVNAAFTVKIIDQPVADRATKLNRYVDGWVKAGAKEKVDAVADVLGSPKYADLKDERADIRDALSRQISYEKVADPKKAMDDIIAKLRAKLPNEKWDF